MSQPGWWDVNRLLVQGVRGPDVERLQSKLNEELGIKLPVNGYFGPDTTEAVKKFQDQNRLTPDGAVGPLTYCTLMETNYRFMLRHPPKIKQTLDTCWAASLQSALESTWNDRPRHTVDDLLRKYKSLLEPGKTSISKPGFRRVISDFRAAHRWLMLPRELRLEPVVRELEKNQRQLLLGFSPTGSIGHVVLIFGWRMIAGDAFLLTMDPLDGDYVEMSVAMLMDRSLDLTLASINLLVV